MTEKRQLPEQMASHTYRKQSASDAMAYPISKQSLHKEASRGERQEVQHSLQRVVTIPDADPSTAWNEFAQRQEQRRRARERPVYEELVPVAMRTYAQTGMRASSGRLKAVRRLPKYSSPVPTRSGHRQSKRGFFWKLLGLFVGIIALVFVANLVLTGSAFRIEHINMVGVHSAVLSHAILHSGIQGQNIFLVNVMVLEGRIEASPFVASAYISKQWPDQVTVNVVERSPVLLWKTAQGTYSVDNQGMVIAPANETPGVERLNTVIDTNSQLKVQSTGHQARSQVAGIHAGVHLNQEDIAFAVSVFERLPQLTGINNFTLRYSGTIYANTNTQSGRSGGRGSYIVESPAGWSAYLGGSNDANPLDNRLIELQKILALLQKQQSNLATIDLRYGLDPVYTLKS
ncbi:MAG TPA: FtsQ-type POTRA domain-containing protein [Ktedonobacteraceae bacterium]